MVVVDNICCGVEVLKLRWWGVVVFCRSSEMGAGERERRAHILPFALTTRVGGLFNPKRLMGVNSRSPLAIEVHEADFSSQCRVARDDLRESLRICRFHNTRVFRGIHAPCRRMFLRRRSRRIYWENMRYSTNRHLLVVSHVALPAQWVLATLSAASCPSRAMAMAVICVRHMSTDSEQYPLSQKLTASEENIVPFVQGSC